MSRQAIIPLGKIPLFCPTCGHSILEKERQRQTHPFRCSNPDIPSPHLTFVSPHPVAVHILFVRLPEGVLGVALGRRGLRYEVAYGKWALPGGFTEAETGDQAAIGEFMEELLVDVSGVSVKHVDERYDPNTYCAIHFYAGLWPYPEPPELKITRESSEVQIAPLDALPEDLAFPYQADIIRSAAKVFMT